MNYSIVVYIAGPYRAKPDPANQWVQEQNIREAEALALEVWKLGVVALCPHTNTRHFQGALPDEAWLAGDLELLDRCDAMLMTPRWQESTGATAEHDYARGALIPIHYTLESLAHWLETSSVARSLQLRKKERYAMSSLPR